MRQADKEVHVYHPVVGQALHDVIVRKVGALFFVHLRGVLRELARERQADEATPFRIVDCTQWYLGIEIANEGTGQVDTRVAAEQLAPLDLLDVGRARAQSFHRGRFNLRTSHLGARDQPLAVQIRQSRRGSVWIFPQLRKEGRRDGFAIPPPPSVRRASAVTNDFPLPPSPLNKIKSLKLNPMVPLECTSIMRRRSSDPG